MSCEAGRKGSPYSLLSIMKVLAYLWLAGLRQLRILTSTATTSEGLSLLRSQERNACSIFMCIRTLSRDYSEHTRNPSSAAHEFLAQVGLRMELEWNMKAAQAPRLNLHRYLAFDRCQLPEHSVSTYDQIESSLMIYTQDSAKLGRSIKSKSMCRVDHVSDVSWDTTRSMLPLAPLLNLSL